MMPIALVAALALTSVPTPAQAPPAAPLRGSGPWTVQFADKLCAMGRKFDGTGGPVTLVVKAPLLGGDYQVTIVAPARVETGPLRGSVKIVGAGANGGEQFVLTAFSSPSKQRIARFSIDGERYKLRDAGAVLALDMGTEGNRAFAVAGLPKALDKLEECTRGLRAAFGIDQALIDSVATKPKGHAPAFFKSEDYPVEALKREQSGTVGVLGFITPEGRFRDCKVIESSKARSIDEATCNVLVARARFTPATGPDGRKVRYPVYTRITWELPDS